MCSYSIQAKPGQARSQEMRASPVLRRFTSTAPEENTDFREKIAPAYAYIRRDSTINPGFSPKNVS